MHYVKKVLNTCVLELHSAVNEESMGDEDSDDEDMTEEEARPDATVKEKSLWVDRYSPKSYMELLSDDVCM